MAWTRFMDMHSGGGAKEQWEYIYIEAPEEEARTIFYNRFHHNPSRVTCTCCGDDYSIEESPTLEEATAYDRGLAFFSPEKGEGRYFEPTEEVPPGWTAGRFSLNKGRGITLEAFLKGAEPEGALRRGKQAHFIHAADIKPEERTGSVPAQGYVWVD